MHAPCPRRFAPRLASGLSGRRQGRIVHHTRLNCAAAADSQPGVRHSWLRARGLAELLVVPGVSDNVVVVLPGNPGVASYYERFATSLATLTDSTVAVYGLQGHTRGRMRSSSLQAFSLDEQEAALLAFLDDVPRGKRVTLVGHSIGAFLALRAAALRPVPVAAVVGLYPFLQLNTSSGLQRLLGVLVRLRPLVELVSALCALVSLLPRWLRSAILSVPGRVAGLEEEALCTTVDWLRYCTAKNVCVLGASEFDAFETLQHSSSALLASLTDVPVALYYGPDDDIWAPPEHAAEAVELARSGCDNLAVDVDPSHGHMFCTTGAGSSHVAARTAALLAVITA
jgi:pimeloyl-ACP methyl ester carboxylesterase